MPFALAQTRSPPGRLAAVRINGSQGMALPADRLVAYLDAALAQGTLSSDLAVALAGTTNLGPTDQFRRLKEALTAYVRAVYPAAVVTVGLMQTMSVQLQPAVPELVAAPILGSAAAQAIADTAAAARNAANALAAAGLPAYDYRPLAALGGDKDVARGLDKMVDDIVSALPALGDLRTAAGHPSRTRWGDLSRAGPGLADATEAEFRNAVRQLLMLCTASGSNRLAMMVSQSDVARAGLASAKAAGEKKAKEAKEASTRWDDEEIVGLKVKFEESPLYGGWRIPWDCLLCKQDTAKLAPLVYTLQLPVSLAKKPKKMRPYCSVGTASALAYKEKLITNPDGSQSWEMDDDDDSSAPLGVMAYYSKVRSWLYTVMALAQGLRVEPPAAAGARAGALWVTPAGILAYLEMLITVSTCATMGAASFIEFGDNALDSVIEAVNKGGVTLDSVLKLEVASMESSLRTVYQHKALLGTTAAASGSLATATAVTGAGAGCRHCPVKDAKIKELNAKVVEITNLDKNKKSLLDRYVSLHGSLPASGGAASAGPSQASAAPGRGRPGLRQSFKKKAKK